MCCDSCVQLCHIRHDQTLSRQFYAQLKNSGESFTWACPVCKITDADVSPTADVNPAAYSTPTEVTPTAHNASTPTAYVLRPPGHIFDCVDLPYCARAA